MIEAEKAIREKAVYFLKAYFDDDKPFEIKIPVVNRSNKKFIIAVVPVEE